MLVLHGASSRATFSAGHLQNMPRGSIQIWTILPSPRRGKMTQGVVPWFRKARYRWHNDYRRSFSRRTACPEYPGARQTSRTLSPNPPRGLRRACSPMSRRTRILRRCMGSFRSCSRVCQVHGFIGFQRRSRHFGRKFPAITVVQAFIWWLHIFDYLQKKLWRPEVDPAHPSKPSLPRILLQLK